MPTNIDVIIPVWNRARAVRHAIDSVLSQRPPPNSTFTVTVVDDGSTDNLSEVLGAYGQRVVCVRHPYNMGAAAARNTGVAAAHGDYVAFLDSDDAWVPDKLIRQVDFMRTHHYPASCGAFLLVRPDRSEIVAPRYPTGALGLSELSWGSFVSPGSTLICSREVFRQIGDFDPALRRLEDWDWLLRYARIHQLGFLYEPLACVKASHFSDPVDALAAIELMEQKHLMSMPAREQRQFRAAVALVRASAYFRNGSLLTAALAVVKSLSVAPMANVALTSVLYNRFARRSARVHLRCNFDQRF